jgi:probable phosphoglycerate mutase
MTTRLCIVRHGETDWNLEKRIQGHTDVTVSHSGVLDVIYRHATGRPLEAPRDFEIPNCALNWFGVDAHGLHLERWADRHHLAQALVEAPE